MGNTISIIRHAFVELLDGVRTLQTINERIAAEPGLPVENPTCSFWMFPPSPIARHCSDLPNHVDVVVIGSGITGTSVAKTLFDRAHAEGRRPVVLMLEARDACSGATGRYVAYTSGQGWASKAAVLLHRNGGHISPPLYHDYAILRQDHGDVIAQKMTKFRLAHLHELRQAAGEESILDTSQWRQVELVDAYYNQELFAKAKAKAEAYQRALPLGESHHRVYESAEAIQVRSHCSGNERVTKRCVEVQVGIGRCWVHRIRRWCHASIQLCDGYPFQTADTVP